MKILLVEDDEKISSFISRGLKEENYTVDISFDGEDALYLATTNSYDLIILDIMIPKIDGLETCKILRAKNILTPIIMLTAKSSIEDKVEGLNEGANDYLTKPFSFEELIARIRVQLRAKTSTTNILELEDLKLDINKKIAIRAKETLSLTAKEYALLEYLFRNKGNIVTSEMINNSLWNMEESTASNIVNVYIYRLRNKIDKNSQIKLLHTLRGVGYKLGVN